jgi:hypothetical protein
VWKISLAPEFGPRAVYLEDIRSNIIIKQITTTTTTTTTYYLLQLGFHPVAVVQTQINKTQINKTQKKKTATNNKISQNNKITTKQQR